VTDRVIRLGLDLNVLYAERLAAMRGVRGSAAYYLVEAIRNGECDAGPMQLIISVPVIENWASVLIRRFGYARDAAEEIAWLLHDYAQEGPLASPPSLVVGSGHMPFAGEAEELAAAAAQMEPGKLFDEIADDRHVLLAAIGGRADLLATGDVDDFRRGPAVGLENRRDLVLFPTASASLVIAKPAFVAHWLRQGIVPDAAFVASRGEEFILPRNGTGDHR
jgi:hypothetical protein